MSVDTASPTRDSAEVVGDRYRLLEPICREANITVWRARDELLARPVAVTVHQPGGEAAAEFLGHAHALSSISHPALARVYDTADEGSRAYVVSEWLEGKLLTDLLRDGPLDGSEAAAMVARIAEGVATAHTGGVYLGGLHPDHLVLTRRGVVAGQLVHQNPTKDEDIRGLGGVLYAALTSRWPLEMHSGRLGAQQLRPAQLVAGHLPSPRQARGGVPHDLSTLAMRALRPEGPEGIHNAEAIVRVLSDRAAQNTSDLLPFGVEPVGERYQQAPARVRRPWLRAAIILLTVGALGAVGLVIGNTVNRLADESTSSTDRQAAGESPQAGGGNPNPNPAERNQIDPVTAELYDPEGDNQENVSAIPNVLDGDFQTAWSTVAYRRTPEFGNLKTGLGLLFDFGRPVELQQVDLATHLPGANVEILVGDSPSGNANSFRVIGQASNISEQSTISLSSSVGAQRFYVVWITRLVPTEENQFRASLAEVDFFG